MSRDVPLLGHETAFLCLRSRLCRESGARRILSVFCPSVCRTSRREVRPRHSGPSPPGRPPNSAGPHGRARQPPGPFPRPAGQASLEAPSTTVPPCTTSVIVDVLAGWLVAVLPAKLAGRCPAPAGSRPNQGCHRHRERSSFNPAACRERNDQPHTHRHTHITDIHTNTYIHPYLHTFIQTHMLADVCIGDNT